MSIPKFSNTSLQRLGSCHEDLQLIFEEVIKIIDCSILEGYRSNETQQEYYRQGKSQKKAGESKHNCVPSKAVDVAPYPINWNDKERFYYFAGIVKGVSESLLKENKITHRIRWGGDWDGDNNLSNQTFFDLPHYELINL